MQAMQAMHCKMHMPLASSSQFTESRQNIMSMYSSITSQPNSPPPSVGAIDAVAYAPNGLSGLGGLSVPAAVSTAPGSSGGAADEGEEAMADDAADAAAEDASN